MDKLKLTKSNIDKLCTGKFQDIEISCLQIWCAKRGKTWYFLKRHNSILHKISIGPYPQISRDQAVAVCNKYLVNLVQYGRLEEVELTASEFTVADANRFYLENKSIANITKRNSYWKYLIPLESTPVSDLTREDLTVLHKKISKKAPVMANHVISTLRAVINYAIIAGKYKGDNPAAHIRRNPESPRQRYLMPSEAPQVIETLRKISAGTGRNKDAADALLLMLYTWQRKSNVLAMKWSEIDETGVWTIPAANAKSRKDIAVPLATEALELLQARKNSSQWVFPNPRTAVGHIVDIKTAWATVKRICGLQDCHIHDLRHTGATYALRSGADITTVSAALAHASVSFTAKVYAHVMTDAKAEAARAAIDTMTNRK